MVCRALKPRDASTHVIVLTARFVRTQLDDYKATEREREKKRVRVARVPAGGGVQKAWELEEDNIIEKMLDRVGPKWKLIVKELPGRNVTSMRKRFERMLKGQKMREDDAMYQTGFLKNRCRACGQPKRGHTCLAKKGGGPQLDLPTSPPHAAVGQ